MSRILIVDDMVASREAMAKFLALWAEAMKDFPVEYRFTYKPHPACDVRLAAFPAIRAEETTETLDRLLAGHDLAIAANSTSAAVDAYVAGLPVVIVLDGAALNLSPLRGHDGVRFVSTPGELVAACAAARTEKADARVEKELTGGSGGSIPRLIGAGRESGPGAEASSDKRRDWPAG